MRIVILHSAVSESAKLDELDNLAEVRAVSEALTKLGHRATAIPFCTPGTVEKMLRSTGPDLVFNLVETVDGSSRNCHLAPQLLETLGIPFTGSGGAAIRTSTSKILTKERLWNEGIRTPSWIIAEDKATPNRRGWPSTRFPADYIVKPIWEEASVGIDERSVMRFISLEDARQNVKARGAEIGSECFAEEFIDGREFNVSIVGSIGEPLILPAAEIVFNDYPAGKRRILDYRAKWEEDSFECRNTIRNYSFEAREWALIEGVRELALASWHCLEMRGYARVDLRTDSTGIPYVLEVNTNPCIASDAGLAYAAAEAGIEYDDLIGRITALAMPSEAQNDIRA